MATEHFTTLGPRARALLERAKFAQDFLDGIEAGTHTWSIGETPKVFASASLDAINKQAREAAGRPHDYTVKFYRVGDDEFREEGVFDGGVDHALGLQILQTAREESGEP